MHLVHDDVADPTEARVAVELAEQNVYKALTRRLPEEYVEATWLAPWRPAPTWSWWLHGSQQQPSARRSARR